MRIIQRHKIILFIILVAAVLRLWGLNVNPPHLTSDETALGYNAYSILKTGRDEHGQFLPVVFESFGDWKPGLYIYLTVPFVALLGLNEWAVRLPGALSGVLAVWLVYLVVGELFTRAGPARLTGPVGSSSRPTSSLDAAVTRRDSLRSRHPFATGSPLSSYISLLSAFFLAISPWHLQFSRGAWEAGVSLALTLAAVYFFLRAVRDKPSWFFLSTVFFALTLWTYQGAKLATLIVVVGLVVFFRKELFSLSKIKIASAVFLAFLVILPILVSILQGKAGRLEIYSVFSYERSKEYVQGILSQGGEVSGSWQYVLYHSEPLNFARGILGRWFNHFSGRFLFFEGDWQNSRHGVPNAGVILLLDGVFLIAGLIALPRLGKSKEALFLWYWLLFASLPAALSRDSVHAIRSLDMVVPLSVILGLGSYQIIIFVLRAFQTRRAFIPMEQTLFIVILLSCYLVIYFLNYVYYLDQYWVHAPKVNSEAWQYGYKQMGQKVRALQPKYSEIVIKQDFSQPYIFFLFYQKYEPTYYQKVSGEVYVTSKYGDVGLVSKLDNITFRDINWAKDRGMKGKLFIVDPIKVPVEDSSDESQFRVVDQIKYLDGTVAFRFVEIL